MSNQKIQIAFNEQIKLELESFYLYLSMAAYFHSIMLNGMAHWMMVQSNKEQKHAMWFFDYLKGGNDRIQLMALLQPKTEWGSPFEAFEDVFWHRNSRNTRNVQSKSVVLPMASRLD